MQENMGDKTFLISCLPHSKNFFLFNDDEKPCADAPVQRQL
jgi:hypothetical protein